MRSLVSAPRDGPALNGKGPEAVSFGALFVSLAKAGAYSPSCHTRGTRTVPPSVGWPFSIRGLIRKRLAARMVAAPKPAPEGVSETTEHPVSVPRAVTWQEMVARPLTPSSRALSG